MYDAADGRVAQGTVSHADWAVAMAAKCVAVLLQLCCRSLGHCVQEQFMLRHICERVRALSVGSETDVDSVFVPIKNILQCSGTSRALLDQSVYCTACSCSAAGAYFCASLDVSGPFLSHMQTPHPVLWCGSRKFECRCLQGVTEITKYRSFLRSVWMLLL